MDQMPFSRRAIQRDRKLYRHAGCECDSRRSDLHGRKPWKHAPNCCGRGDKHYHHGSRDDERNGRFADDISRRPLNCGSRQPGSPKRYFGPDRCEHLQRRHHNLVWYLAAGNANATGSIVGAVVNNDTFDIFNANTTGITTITNSGGTTNFFNASTAASAVITNDFGTTNFLNASTAGNALIVTNGGGFTNSLTRPLRGTPPSSLTMAGSTEFFDTSTAENAALTNNSGGEAEFNNTS